MAFRLFHRPIMRRFDCARSFRAAATDRSVDPPDWSDAGRQRSLIKQLLSPFLSFRSFVCIGYFMIQAASDQAFLPVVIPVCLGTWLVWALGKSKKPADFDGGIASSCEMRDAR